MAFSDEQKRLLAEPLDQGLIHTRTIRGATFAYLEGFVVMEAANAVFGYDGWGYTVPRLEEKDGIWVALVRVSVFAGGDEIVREDVGVGIPAQARDAAKASPEAQETAIKGAVTDALKRALRGYGDQFGLSLYDKDGEDANVRPGSAQPATARSATTPRPPTPAPAAVRQPTTTPPAATAAKPAPPAAAAKAPSGTVQPDSRALWNVLLDEAAKKGYEKEGMAEWAKQHIQAVFEKQSLADLTAQEWDALIHEVKQAPGAAEAATR